MQQKHKINLVSFLEDTGKLIQEGCHRKAILQFQLFPISHIENVKREQYYQFYHRQIHALIKILMEYKFKGGTQKSKPNMIHLMIKVLRQWIQLYSKDGQSNRKILEKQLNHLRKYFTKAGIILLHECKNLEQAKILIQTLFKFEQESLYEMKNNMNQCLYYKVILHFNAAVTLLKFSSQKQSYEFALQEFLYVIHEFQIILPTISNSHLRQYKNSLGKHSLFFKFVSITEITFLLMGYIFEQTYQMGLARECILISEWFMTCYFGESQKQLHQLIQSRMNDINRYSNFIVEMNEIEKVLKMVYPEAHQQKKNKISLLQELNSQIYRKYDYEKLQKIQFIKKTTDIQEVQLRPQSPLNKRLHSKNTSTVSHKGSVSKFNQMSTEQGSTMATSRNESSMPLASTQIPTSSFYVKAHVNHESTNSVQRDTSPAQRDSTREKLITPQAVTLTSITHEEKDDEMKNFLGLFVEKEEKNKDEIRRPEIEKLNKLLEKRRLYDEREKIKLTDHLFETMIHQKLNQTSECKEFIDVVQKIKQEISRQKFITDQTMFGIKFLNQKKKNCKIHGKEPGTGSQLNTIHFKNRTEVNFQREAFNQLNIIRAKNTINPLETVITQVKISDLQNPIYDTQSPAKKAQQIILKHSNKLGLQSFKRELKRNHHNQQIQRRKSLVGESDEVVNDQEDGSISMKVLKGVQSLNKQVLTRMMDEYENGFQNKPKLHKQKSDYIDTKRSQSTIQRNELGRSTYLNFVQDSLRKAAASGLFTELVMAQYKVVQSKKLKRKGQIDTSHFDNDSQIDKTNRQIKVNEEGFLKEISSLDAF